MVIPKQGEVWLIYMRYIQFYIIMNKNFITNQMNTGSLKVMTICNFSNFIGDCTADTSYRIML